MPAPRSTWVPFFSGRVVDPLKDFMHEYEILADTYRLSKWEKVETITRYVLGSLQEFWQSLDRYNTQNWDEFCWSLESQYPEGASQNRYSKQCLYNLIWNTSWLQMRDEDDELEYY
jgi:hypothetical protein